MRITTQMLNESARKAGLPINRSSLLNYINKDSSANPLLGSLSKNSAAAKVTQKTGSEKLEKSADRLSHTAETLSKTGTDSIYEKAKKSGDCKEIYSTAENFVNQYNDLLGELGKSSGTLNDYYRQSLRELASDNKNALADIGITLSKDGTLQLDQDKLHAADADAVRQALSGASDFSKKVAFLAGRVSDNAQSSAASLSGQYSSSGEWYSALAGKYNLRG